MGPIKHTLNLSADASAVYEAVTQPACLYCWWAKDGDIATEVGGETELRFVKEGTPVTMRFRVDALDAGKRVAWTCIENPNPIWVGSTLVWDIESNGSGATLNFCHDNFTAGGPPWEMTSQGWQHFMKSFETYMKTGAGEPW